MGWGFGLLVVCSAQGRMRGWGGRGGRGPQDGARGRRHWGRRGCSPAYGADLSLLIIGCARGGRRGRAGAQGQCGAGVARPLAKMRPRGQRCAPPRPMPQRVLQGPSRYAWVCAGISAGEGIKTLCREGSGFSSLRLVVKSSCCNAVDQFQP